MKGGGGGRDNLLHAIEKTTRDSALSINYLTKT